MGWGGVGWQTCRPCVWERVTADGPALPRSLGHPTLPVMGMQLAGLAVVSPGASFQPLTLDKHSDLKQSWEHQPFHQERLNLLGVRSHKS